MTFYQELQLNQAGSKKMLKTSETRREKAYHTLVYLVKIALTMIFCFGFVTVFSILFGNENSIVGVVVLYALWYLEMQIWESIQDSQRYYLYCSL